MEQVALGLPGPTHSRAIRWRPRACRALLCSRCGQALSELAPCSETEGARGELSTSRAQLRGALVRLPRAGAPVAVNRRSPLSGLVSPCPFVSSWPSWEQEWQGLLFSGRFSRSRGLRGVSVSLFRPTRQDAALCQVHHVNGLLIHRCVSLAWGQQDWRPVAAVPCSLLEDRSWVGPSWPGTSTDRSQEGALQTEEDHPGDSKSQRHMTKTTPPSPAAAPGVGVSGSRPSSSGESLMGQLGLTPVPATLATAREATAQVRM